MIAVATILLKFHVMTCTPIYSNLWCDLVMTEGFAFTQKHVIFSLTGLINNEIIVCGGEHNNRYSTFSFWFLFLQANPPKYKSINAQPASSGS